jgi:hypothetical protein
MSETYAGGIQLVEVTTDIFVKGRPKKQLWIAASSREEAVSMVLAQVPEGWTASLSAARLRPDEVALLRMRAGDVRELTK